MFDFFKSMITCLKHCKMNFICQKETPVNRIKYQKQSLQKDNRRFEAFFLLQPKLHCKDQNTQLMFHCNDHHQSSPACDHL